MLNPRSNDEAKPLETARTCSNTAQTKSLGEIYCEAVLVRVAGEMTRGPGKPPMAFCCGLLLDPAGERVIFAAPLLSFLIGQRREQLRRTFARLDWRATIVPRRRTSTWPD